MMHAYKEGERAGEWERGTGGGQHLQHVTQPPKWASWPIGQSGQSFYDFIFGKQLPPFSLPPPLLISRLPLRLRHSSQGSSSFPIPRFDVLFTAVSLLDSCSETCHATAMCKQETCAWAEWGKTTVNLKLKLISLLLLLLCCNCKWQPFFSVVAPCNTSHALVLFLSRIESRVSRSASSAKSH